MIINGIRLKNGKIILENFHLSFEKNIIVIQGNNGAGKSTLLKILSRKDFIEKFCKYSQSEINFVNSSKAVFLDFDFSSVKLNTSTFIKYLKELYLVKNNLDFESFIQKLLLEEYLTKPFQKLSFGTRKKIIVSTALSSEKSIILLDELFENIDDLSHKIISERINYLSENGKTILITAHNVSFLKYLEDYELIRIKNFQ